MYKLGLTLRQTVQGSEYTNNQPVDFSEILPYVNISNWTDVKALDKIAIEAAALADGFVVES